MRNAGCFLGHVRGEQPNVALSALRSLGALPESREANDLAARHRLLKVQAKSALSGIPDVDRNVPPLTTLASVATISFFVLCHICFLTGFAFCCFPAPPSSVLPRSALPGVLVGIPTIH